MSTFVWVERAGDEIAPASLEALGAARGLAGPVTALVFGREGVRAASLEVLRHGADEVIEAEDATLSVFRLAPYKALLTALVREHRPRAVIAGATAQGGDLLGCAAFELGAALLPDVVTLASEDGHIRAVRPVYGGKLTSTEISQASVTFITTRLRAFAALPADPPREWAGVQASPVLAEADIAVRLEGFMPAAEQMSLSDARVVVSGGRGVGGPEGFAVLRELADVLGGAVGASRAAVDAGWISYVHQIGQTGRVVSPDLYIACGISGAEQHLAGMRTSRVIVAINKDAGAPIFRAAHYGIVGDLFEAVPALAAALRRTGREPR